MRGFLRLMIVVAMAISGIAVAPVASADHQAPSSGTVHSYGQLIDYPLVFPVQGDHWYQDWFWAYRANGLHHAQDIMAEKMVPVVAAATGTVTYVNWSTDPANLNPHRCCNLVILHDDGWQSWYIHLNNDTPGTDDGQAWGIAPGIVPGTRVNAGDVIGWVGDSGNAENTAPHLHFELYDPEGVLVNPFDALRRSQGLSVCSVRELSGVSALVEGKGRLKKGSVGEQVRALQVFLDTFDFQPGPIDGIFGRVTKRTVKAFQEAYDLEVNGKVKKPTRSAIVQLTDLADKASVLNPDSRIIGYGASGADVAEIQGLLAVVGHDPGPPDGYFGATTHASVQAFQEARGLPVDGIIGQGTRAAISELLGLTALIDCDF